MTKPGATPPGSLSEPCPACGCPGAEYDGHCCEDYLEARAEALVEYGNALPDGVSTEAFAEAANLRREARRLRG